MSMVSHLHQLFNPETCQSYIHMLRWKDRPLQCPRCQSHNVGPWGAYHYQPGPQRYRCKEKDCKRTFNDLTGTLLDGSKRSVMHWILATFLLCLSCSSRRIARELGVHIRTGYRWCWWLRKAALSYTYCIFRCNFCGHWFPLMSYAHEHNISGRYGCRESRSSREEQPWHLGGNA